LFIARFGNKIFIASSCNNDVRTPAHGCRVGNFKQSYGFSKQGSPKKHCAQAMTALLCAFYSPAPSRKRLPRLPLYFQLNTP